MADTTKLEISVILSAVDRMTAIISKATSAAAGKFEAFSKKANAISEKAAKIGQGAAIGAFALAAPLVFATKKAIDFEAAMADVGKVANLNKGSAGLQKLSNEALNLSKYLATDAKDVGSLYASLLAGGTSVDQLAKVSKIAGQAAVAFDMTQQAAGDAYSVMRNAMGLTVDQTKVAFDQVNALTNKFGRRGSELLEMMSGGGASTARALGISSGAMLAFGQTMIASGTSASETGTVLEALTRNLNKNAAAMKIFKDGGGGGEGLSHLLSMANASGNAMQWFMQHGFDRQSSKFALLAMNAGQFQKALKYVGIQTNVTNSAQKEFENRMNTTEMKLKRAKEGFYAAAIQAGTAFLPVVTKILEKITPFIEKLSRWIARNPELTATIVKTTAGLALFLGTVSAVSFAVSGVMKFASGMSSVFGFLTKAIGWLATAFRALTAVMIANPIILIVTGIALSALLIYKFWEPIKRFFIMLWDGIKAVFWKALDWVKQWGFLFLGPVIAPVGLIIKYWDKIVAFLRSLSPKMFDAGKNIIKSIAAGITSLLHKPFELIKNMVQKVRNLLPFSPAKEGPLRDIHKIRLVETIADTIKPGPMMKAMRIATASALIAVAPMKSMSVPSTSGRAGSGQGFTYSPTINIYGGGAGLEASIKKMLQEQAREIYKIVMQQHQKEKRTDFK